MSIAVRVSVWILGLCVIVSAGFAVMTYLEKQTLETQNQRLHREITDDENQISDSRVQIKQLQDDASQLKDKITQQEQEKSKAKGEYSSLKSKADDLQSQITQANSQRDDWKSRVDTISRERDALMQKLKDQQSQLEKLQNTQQPAVSLNNNAPQAMGTPEVMVPGAGGGLAQGEGSDHYLASVILQKADLQIQVQKQKFELDQAALQVADLKKQNSDLDLELQQVGGDKDELIQKIKYGQDLADNLSIDLARARNDQQAVDDRADKLKAENMQLLEQIRDLTSTKFELEKNIAHLMNDKDAMQRKLIETESVIQSRINDIWKIKNSLDQKIAENAPTSSAGGTELPPIVVNASNNQIVPAQAAVAPVGTMAGKTRGSIISINEPNNFVIVDLGQENSSVAVGNTLKVYRDSNPIASLEIIQVRRDICAADIKDKSVGLRVGDIVSFY